MSDLPPSQPDIGQHAAEASGLVESVGQAGGRAADAIDKAFGRAGESITRSLSKAASDGKISFGELASAALTAFEAFAKAPGSGSVLGNSGSLSDALGGVLADIFKPGGARADGGPVAAGSAYLVGERGPELFRPGTSGEIMAAGVAGSMVVNVTVQGGGAAGLLRSEAQIASALARAVSLGARA